ncbi:MAG: hypothetical protein RI911_686 [Candidatus Parcubacteria bacterium]|jgi:hypothetical protein
MGQGTIQQQLKRIKQRYRLFVYDTRLALMERFSDARAWIETERAKAIMEIVSLCSIAIISFFVGRNSVVLDARPGFQHDTAARIERMEPKPIAAVPRQGKVVVSKNGKRWHYAWCPGAETISERNKRWYSSEAEAEKAGYTRASNCK